MEKKKTINGRREGPYGEIGEIEVEIEIYRGKRSEIEIKKKGLGTILSFQRDFTIRMTMFTFIASRTT